MVEDREAWCAGVHGVGKEPDTTEQLNKSHFTKEEDKILRIQQLGQSHSPVDILLQACALLPREGSGNPL